MIELIIRTTASSGFFILFYFLLLQREKMFQFNRFYLIAGMMLSILLPFVVFSVEGYRSLNPEFLNDNLVIPMQPHSRENENSFSVLTVVTVTIYLSGVLFMMFRFLRNIHSLSQMIHGNKQKKENEVTWILVKRPIATFSFLHYIFTPEEDLENHKIHPDILQHEMAHIRQKHTLDILLTELLLIFLWFNPFLYLYRKTILANHEFLADAEVLKHNNNPVTYQQLLLDRIRAQSEMVFVSPFNFKLTERRFRLMFRKKSVAKSVFLKSLSLLLCILAFGLFSRKAYSQSPAVKGNGNIEYFRDYKIVRITVSPSTGVIKERKSYTVPPPDQIWNNPAVEMEPCIYCKIELQNGASYLCWGCECPVFK